MHSFTHPSIHPSTNPCIHASMHQSIRAFIHLAGIDKRDKELFKSGEQEPWVHRGGLLAEFRVGGGGGEGEGCLGVWGFGDFDIFFG